MFFLFQDYLKEFGYISGIMESEMFGSLTETEAMPMAIEEFQRFAGIEVTGTVQCFSICKMVSHRTCKSRPKYINVQPR